MSNATVADRMAQAVRYHKQGDLAVAERLYGEVLQAVPAHFDALLMSGVLRFQQQDSKGAEERLRGATRANPSSPVAWLNLGVAQEAQRLLPEALASYDRALTLQARYPEALFNRANVLLGLGVWRTLWPATIARSSSIPSWCQPTITVARPYRRWGGMRRR